ncbi:MAG: hypothetical protein ACREUT_09450 [Steroidobacteraceae bacterium]
MAIEHVRICGGCERECPGWANRCPVCGSLSLLYRITVVPAAAAVVPEAQRAASGRAPASGQTAAHKGITRSRAAAAREAKLHKTPLGGNPETRAV